MFADRDIEIEGLRKFYHGWRADLLKAQKDVSQLDLQIAQLLDI